MAESVQLRIAVVDMATNRIVSGLWEAPAEQLEAYWEYNETQFIWDFGVYHGLDIDKFMFTQEPDLSAIDAASELAGHFGLDLPMAEVPDAGHSMMGESMAASCCLSDVPDWFRA